MRESRTSGSVGALGRQLPRATRLFLLDDLGMTVPYLTVFLVRASRRLIAEAN
jgi:hypothetical protein